MRKCLNTVIPYSLVTQIIGTFNAISKEKMSGREKISELS
jgi:hypothetical protein